MSNFQRFFLFVQYFNLLFYIELLFAFWITWILKIENPKIESFSSLANLVLDNIVCIYSFISS